MSHCVAIFAHEEERRIEACLANLPLDRTEIDFHVLVNGSSDRTAELAQLSARKRANVHIHDLHPGGKARTWNRFVFDIDKGRHDVIIFMDGDATIKPGSLDALADTLAANPLANAASGMPLNGRNHLTYQAELKRDRGLFGDLYALRGDFLRRMQGRNIRLPEDLIGDDGLIAALAATDLRSDAHWDKERVVPCEDAGFYCEPVNLLTPRTLPLQYRRMINYSIRYFQNRIISDIMQNTGPEGLPERLTDLYPDYLPSFHARRSPGVAWFDFLALRRMTGQASII
ncbi:MAG: glycosyltransferase [Alphaproteobacteria bacterium]|nr:glycosyltransferase [Alphaproteobacteria bacterium]